MVTNYLLTAKIQIVTCYLKLPAFGYPIGTMQGTEGPEELGTVFLQAVYS